MNFGKIEKGRMYTGMLLDGLKIKNIDSWLHNDVLENSIMNYRHNLIRENKVNRDDIINELMPVIRKAHDDARFALREALCDELDPLEDWDDDIDPADGYPEILDLTTLKGYFGEFFSGVVAENFHPFKEENWRVPVFPFRFHHTAFDQLEMFRQTNKMKKATYGRTGDDCVAFVLKNERIVKTLFLEAKCTSKHNSSMINDAHTKISSKNQKPVELMRLIQALKAYKNNDEAKIWIKALRGLYKSEDEHERFDSVSYVCGKLPQRNISWISRENPNVNYQGSRNLEVLEIQIADIDELVKKLYGKES